MADYRTLSQDLAAALSLKFEPAGVTLYKETDHLPPGLPFTDEKFKSYCQALVLAGAGRTLLLQKDQMGCKLGTAVLGFEKGRELEEYLDDGVLEKYGVGLYASEEASAATIRKAVYLEPGQTKAALIAPLSAFTEAPQVVVFTADSEQVMWLLYAVNFERGGRMELPQSGGALGGCSDITAMPLLQGTPNITFLGLGCRIKTNLDPCHLMLGIPGSGLENTHRHIQEMAKPIAMLRKARAGG
ncbi:MAG: hypothetical protein C4567_14900 [Deltaproteobacteria bacterium]|nr:MAG: hypothetical protein C4567_14900 [Deltaproteobacteria bacterium]